MLERSGLQRKLENVFLDRFLSISPLHFESELRGEKCREEQCVRSALVVVVTQQLKGRALHFKPCTTHLLRPKECDVWISFGYSITIRRIEETHSPTFTTQN